MQESATEGYLTGLRSLEGHDRMIDPVFSVQCEWTNRSVRMDEFRGAKSDTWMYTLQADV